MVQQEQHRPIQRGITSGLFYSFRDHLEASKERFALLQLVGRLENYLVIEFIHHVHLQSQGTRLAITNVGNRGEQKIDIAILRGELDGQLSIETLVECKYLRNCHRAWPELNACDESRPAIMKLAEQVGRVDEHKPTHGGINLRLIGRRNDIYGLVFASFVSTSKADAQKTVFLRKQRDIACSLLRYHDQDTPRFKMAYEDVKVSVLGGERYVSLGTGLWRLQDGE
ncbi:MAG: hypothetical protein V2A77_01180 [Pseudomonadota bacterium]